MFFLKAAFCRVFQTAFRIALPFLPYREPQIVNTCAELGTVFSVEKIKSVLIVTDKGIVNNGLLFPLEESLKASNVAYTIYDKTQPNPTEQITKQGKTCSTQRTKPVFHFPCPMSDTSMQLRTPWAVSTERHTDLQMLLYFQQC